MHDIYRFFITVDVTKDDLQGIFPEMLKYFFLVMMPLLNTTLYNTSDILQNGSTGFETPNSKDFKQDMEKEFGFADRNI